MIYHCCQLCILLRVDDLQHCLFSEVLLGYSFEFADLVARGVTSLCYMIAQLVVGHLTGRAMARYDLLDYFLIS